MAEHDVVAEVHHDPAPQGGGGTLFSMDPGLMLWTWVVFALLFIVLRKYAWGPMMTSVRERERVMADAVENARKTKEELATIAERQKELLQQTNEQARQIMDESRREAEAAARTIADRARKDAEATAKSAQEQIVRERERAMDQIRRQAVDLVIEASEALVETSLDDEAHRQIVQRKLEEL